jgi:hypothetical protein
MPRGGRRDGAGRPKGGKRPEYATSKAITVAREEIAEEIKKRTEDLKAMRSIDVMREIMMWSREKANDMLVECEKLAKENAIPAAIDFFKESVDLRKLTLKCAEGIIPYEEPRLSAVVPLDPNATPSGDQAVAGPKTIDHDHLEHLTKRYTKGAQALKVVNGGKG